jgi:hypothetical protein
MRFAELLFRLTDTRPGAALLSLASWGFLGFCIYAMFLMAQQGEPWYAFVIGGAATAAAALETFFLSFIVGLPRYALTGRR